MSAFGDVSFIWQVIIASALVSAALRLAPLGLRRMVRPERLRPVVRALDGLPAALTGMIVGTAVLGGLFLGRAGSLMDALEMGLFLAFVYGAGRYLISPTSAFVIGAGAWIGAGFIP